MPSCCGPAAFWISSSRVSIKADIAIFRMKPGTSIGRTLSSARDPAIKSLRIKICRTVGGTCPKATRVNSSTTASVVSWPSSRTKIFHTDGGEPKRPGLAERSADRMRLRIRSLRNSSLSGERRIGSSELLQRESKVGSSAFSLVHASLVRSGGASALTAAMARDHEP